MKSHIDFKSIAPDVCKALLGEPNSKLSKPDELRYGSNGSLSLDLTKATYFNFEANEGGGLLDLIKRETSTDPLEWLRINHFITDTRQQDTLAAFQNLTAPDVKPKPKQDREHIYTTAEGEPLYRVQVRYKDEGKKAVYLNKFDTEKGLFVKNMEGVKYVPYALPELVNRPNETVYICEGEKDCNNLKEMGLLATCNVAGARKWDNQANDLNPYFKGRDVVIFCDNDKVGLEHGQMVANSLLSLASTVKLIDVSIYWPDMPPKGDISDAIDAGATLSDIKEMVEHAPYYGSIKERDFLKDTAISADWFSVRPPNRPTIISGLLPEGITAILGGAGGVGKSAIALQMGACIAAGYPFLEREVSTGKVLYLSAEDDRDEVRRRLYDYVNALEVDFSTSAVFNRDNLISNLLVKDLVGDGLLLTRTVDGVAVVSPDVDKIEQAVSNLENLKLIIVDTYSRLNGGKENSNEDAATFVRACERLSKRTGATVLIAAHMTKGAGGVDGIAGGKRFSDSARLAMVVQSSFHKMEDDYKANVMKALGEPLDNWARYVKLTIEKDNYCGNMGKSFSLRRSEGSAVLEACTCPNELYKKQRGEKQGLSPMEIKKEARKTAIRTELLILIEEKNVAGDALTRYAIRNNYAGATGRFGASFQVIAPVIQEMIDKGELGEVPIQPKGAALYVSGGTMPSALNDDSKEKGGGLDMSA
jgi:hypothetical protein